MYYSTISSTQKELLQRRKWNGFTIL